MIPPAKLRQILELRRSTRAPPLLPPKKSSSKRADEAKKSSQQQKEIVDIHVQLRNIGVALASGSIACAFSESESDNHRGPWRMTTASELLSKGTSAELPNVFAVEFQLENAAKFIRLDICDLFAKDVLSVGYCVFSVSELVSATGCKIQRKVMNDESGFEVADALISCTIRSKSHAVVLQFVAKNLSKKHLSNSSSAQVFFEIHRLSTGDNIADELDGMTICNGGIANNASANMAPPSMSTTAPVPNIGDCAAAEAGGASFTAPSHKGSLLYRSEGVKWNSSRVPWRAFTLQSTDIMRKELRMLCFQRDTAKSPAFPPVSLGEFPLFYSVLRRGPGPENIYFLVYENSRHQKKNGGTFELCRLHEVCTPSFLEYISAGASLNLAFAVDFSRSGIFVDEQLIKHYINDVELVIGAFGSALRDFNSANSYPAFGFGAKIPPLFRESQEFCLDLNGTDPYCRGISGVLNAFKTSFATVEPLNMAHLSHVIYYMAKLAQNSLCRIAASSNCVELGAEYKPPNYFVLVIITRGIFDDLKETVQSLIFASRAPLSIVFVGIGEDEQQLTELERLATAGTRLNFHGRKPERDCTQYVSLPLCRKEEGKMNDLKLSIVERGLSSISAQMCNWMMRNGYQKVEHVPEMVAVERISILTPFLRHQLFPPHPPPETDNDSTTHPPPTDRAAAFFGNNGEECQSEHSSSRSSKASPPPPLKRGIRMRQSAQCLTMGRSSSSFSSFGSNKFFAGGVYSSAPGSAFSITPSDAAVSDWPLDRNFRNLELICSCAPNGNNECVGSATHSSPGLRRLSNKMPSNGCNPLKNATAAQKTMTAIAAVSPPFESASRNGAAGTGAGGCVAGTARHRQFAESRSLSTATNWCKMRNAIAEAGNGNDGGGVEALLLTKRTKAAAQMANCAAPSTKAATADKCHPMTTTVAPEAVPHYQLNSAENVNGEAN
ncbi:hypothetical protein niasHS_005392 [Heterodera schachtii]|uniref:Copine C-terminal domain-containing protein n=1 Tax=Heterodera schachtii TaxID=97005 RepID=A0ABD2J966_HETSC